MKKERIQARGLILILSSAVFIAFVAVVGWIYYFGSSGTYLLHDVLIPPAALEKTPFVGYDSSTQGVARYIFAKIEFVRAEKQGREAEIFTINPQTYANFYKWVTGERSLPVITDEMKNQFNSPQDNLKIFVRLYDGSTEERIFQQVQFIEGGDLFRVQTRPSPLNRHAEEWIYFRYPGIYEHVLNQIGYTK